MDRYIVERHNHGFGIFEIKRSMCEPVAWFDSIDSEIAHRVCDFLNGRA